MIMLRFMLIYMDILLILNPTLSLQETRQRNEQKSTSTDYAGDTINMTQYKPGGLSVSKRIVNNYHSHSFTINKNSLDHNKREINFSVVHERTSPSSNIHTVEQLQTHRKGLAAVCSSLVESLTLHKSLHLSKRQLTDHITKIKDICVAKMNIRSKRNIQVPGLSKECYVKKGDVMFGLLTSIRGAGSGSQLCSEDLFWDAAVQETEAFVYALETVSERRGILQNISMGYLILDDCNTDLAALTRSLFFLPDSNGKISQDGNFTSNSCDLTPGTFKIMGVVGPYGSRRAALSASLLGAFHIPLISTYATSDELSDQRRFPYFLRLVAPDRTQAKAMVDFAASMNWTYAALLYSEGVYGENGAKSIQTFAGEFGICLGLIRQISSVVSKAEINSTVCNILQNTTIKLVFLFMEDYHLYMMFPVVHESGFHKQLIWLASDAMAYDQFGPGADGAFVMHHIDGYHPKFDDYYKTLTPDNSSNPWLKDLWKSLFNCRWDNPDVDLILGFSNSSCKLYEDIPYDSHSIESYVYKTIDAADMLAAGLEELLSSRCPGYSSLNSSQHCLDHVKGRDFLEVLKSINFTGISGQIDFQGSGSMRGRFAVKQYLAVKEDRGETIAVWEENSDIEMFYDDIDVNVYKMKHTKSGLPESVCSQPCQKGFYKVQLQLPCCWECRPCRPNERLNHNMTGCVTCSEATWPDPLDSFSCKELELNYLHWGDSLSIGLLVICLFGFGSSLLVAGLTFKWRDNKLIKASSRDLSSIILFGITGAFISVILFLTPPQNATCQARYICFHLVGTFIFAPLLMKTNRVYRIFVAGKKGIQHPSFISTTAQFVGIGILLALQVILVVVSSSRWPPVPDVRMPIPNEPYAEKFCRSTTMGLFLPLSFNLLLIFVCAVFGFLTRKLPENFNESWYIFVSVTTTLFLWAVFLPTYFSVFYAYLQAALLALCLILNATVTLLCLFVTRLYAVVYVTEDMMHLQNSLSTNAVVPLYVSTVS